MHPPGVVGRHEGEDGGDVVGRAHAPVADEAEGEVGVDIGWHLVVVGETRAGAPGGRWRSPATGT